MKKFNKGDIEDFLIFSFCLTFLVALIYNIIMLGKELEGQSIFQF